MSHRQNARTRWSTAARWPLGILLTAWRYLWRTTPVHRWEMTGSSADDAAPDLPDGVDLEGLQLPQDGFGPLLHRIYRTRIVGSPATPEALMEQLVEDLDRMAPTEFASFQRLDADGPLAVGDEYVVRMPGPWDGPVRAVAVTPTSFRLATLDGHLEAGQIEFRARAGHRSLVFEIESWARSGDRFSRRPLLAPAVAKEVQLHMWTSVLGEVVDLAHGRMSGGGTVTTSADRHASARGRERERPAGARSGGWPRWPSATGQLRHLADRRAHARARLARRRHDRAAAPRGIGTACRGRQLGGRAAG